MKTLAQTNNYIVLDNYERKQERENSYQSEADLEREFISDLQKQGYEYITLKNRDEMLENIKKQIESLNELSFSQNEWKRFLEEYLDKASDNSADKSRKIQSNSIYDFIFDDGKLKNIKIIDKENLSKNKLQILQQFQQSGTFNNRYDVTILVNGLPLVQIELKKRGIALKEAFNQIHRYSKESFNSDNSLYKFLQIFVISNGTNTKYFANTLKRDKNSYDFTMNWANAKNKPIKDLKDFTATFFEKNTLLHVLFSYTIFDVEENLLIMRPYQIAATERILQKIREEKWKEERNGGFIWHTTGSGKTLTSFKAASLASALPSVDKVLFVVDRKDLDYQTMKEYKNFSPDSVNGSIDTKALKENLEKNDNKIVVTTIQKLNNLLKKENSLAIYNKNVVLIFDECHRSQFGEAQKNIRKKFKNFYQFGFTGTPIKEENSLTTETTEGVFGQELHSYLITDAIRDEKVLKFKVDYNNVKAQFKDIESEEDEKKLSALEEKAAFLHPNRISEITNYILNNFHQKTHRFYSGAKGFNAIFAVSSIEAAKAYYQAFKAQQAERLAKDKDYQALKIATIFSFAANENQEAIGEIKDESFDVGALNSSSKEFLNSALQDYNANFSTSYNLNSEEGFQNYYRDLAKRVKNQEVDLLIVVGMFLTGFDAKTLNTLFVDKNLRYHGLIQAYSRTNRIYNSTKSFGNIVTFRDLEDATIKALTLFGKTNSRAFLLEKSYSEYMNGFTDKLSGEEREGFINILQELKENFPVNKELQNEEEKKAFVKLFSSYLKSENILENYDEFAALKAWQNVDKEQAQALEEFKEKYYLDDEKIKELEKITLISERELQDYKSIYNDIREEQRRIRAENKQESLNLTWDDVVFEVDLLKSQEINLDYILALLLEKAKKQEDKESLIEEAKRLLRSSLDNRAKESLVVDFLAKNDLSMYEDKASFIEAFFLYAKKEQQKEAELLIQEENLHEAPAKRYLEASLKREYASQNGTALNEILPKISPLKPEYRRKKQNVFQKISSFVNKFKGISTEL